MPRVSPPDTPLVLDAPASWQALDFISDLHLQAGDRVTFDAWHRYMATTPADAVFILGDLFEVWVGDDADGPFERDCRQVLQAAAARLGLFFMHGNRDFLVGQAFLDGCGARLLPDPTVLAAHGQRWLLSHGDALCLDDHDYQRFRAEVRSPAWQQGFLARPLAERQAIARGLRNESEARKGSGAAYADADAALVDAWLAASRANTLIHGHTHRPADHALADGRRRIVLSDWDAQARPARLQVLRLAASGLQRIDLAPCSTG